MKNLIKTIFAIILVAVLSFSFVGCDSSTDKETESGLVVKKFKGDDFYTVVDYIAEDNVTTLNLGDYNKSGVVIGRIKAGAFDGNSSLVEVVVPTTVSEIDAGAFKGMKGLEKITLPYIGAYKSADAFYHQNQSGDNRAVDKERNFAYIFGTDSYDGGAEVTCTYGGSNSQTYYIPSTLYEVTIAPEGEYQIPMYAFNGLTQIVKVNLTGNITAIGEYAFANFKTLRTVNILNTVDYIYDHAFDGCENLTNSGLVLEDLLTLEKIGEKAFIGTGLTEIKFSVKEIGESAFAELGLTKGTLTNVETIGDYAFYGCEDLEVENANVFTINGSAVVKSNYNNTVFKNTKLSDR